MMKTRLSLLCCAVAVSLLSGCMSPTDEWIAPGDPRYDASYGHGKGYFKEDYEERMHHPSRPSGPTHVGDVRVITRPRASGPVVVRTEASHHNPPPSSHVHVGGQYGGNRPPAVVVRQRGPSTTRSGHVHPRSGTVVGAPQGQPEAPHPY